MEFNFRAIDRKPLTYIPRTSTSSTSYFTKQALRVGYLSPNFGNTAEYFRNPDPMDEVQRELEKKRIREEIIAAERTRRRALEEEVRIEMMVERQMALHRGGDGFSIFSGFEERLPILHQSEESLSNGGRGGGFETMRFQRSIEPKITEVKPCSEVVSKEKVIFVAKPEGNMNTSGAKRKAVSPPPTGDIEPPSVGSKKKLKEDWSCDICHVTTTSEGGLNQHFQGKKHKSKEAGLTVQTAGKNYSIGLFPKETAKPIKLEESNSNKNLDQLEKSATEGVRPNNELALVVFQDDSKNKNGDPLKNMQVNDGDSKRERCNFWCEMCKVGAFSEKVMNKHRKGKKHVRNLQLLEKGSRSEVAVKVEEATHWKESETEVDHKAEEEEMPKNENVDGATTDGEMVENHETMTNSDC